MKIDPLWIGADLAKGPDRTATIIRDADGRYRHATEEETLRFRKQQAYGHMKEKFNKDKGTKHVEGEA